MECRNRRHPAQYSHFLVLVGLRRRRGGRGCRVSRVLRRQNDRDDSCSRRVHLPCAFQYHRDIVDCSMGVSIDFLPFNESVLTMTA